MLLSLILLLKVLEKRLYTYQKTKYQLDVNELIISEEVSNFMFF